MSESIECPQCGAVSYNANDIREGYCGHCHDWTTPKMGWIDGLYTRHGPDHTTRLLP